MDNNYMPDNFDRIIGNLVTFSTAMEKFIEAFEQYHGPEDLDGLLVAWGETVSLYLKGIENTHIDSDGIIHIMDKDHVYCSSCKQEKHTNSFSKSKRSRTGYQGWCNQCRKKYRE